MEGHVHMPRTPGGVLASFVMMSACFSLTHGCVVTSLALATDQLGPRLGSYSAGILYLVYTASALLFAPDIVKRLGEKNSLSWGCVLYCTYVGSYAVALASPDIRWTAVIFGAVLGGLAAGWLWTAQGAYFSSAAEQYARAQGTGPEAPSTPEATSLFGGIFATLYLGTELALKLTSSAVLRMDIDNPGRNLFTVYTSLAVLASLGMFVFVPSMTSPARLPAVGAPAGTEGPAATPLGKRKLFLALQLMVSDPKIIALAPINTSFGFVASMLNFYVNGAVVNVTLGARLRRAVSPGPLCTHAQRGAGSSAIGVLTAVLSGVATLISLPLSYLSPRIGRTPIILLGAVVFLFEVVVLYGLTVEEVGHWPVLVCLFSAHGVGRAVWEGPNRALIADYFPDDREGAFANIIMQNGVASTVGYFLFPHLSAKPMLVICGVNLLLWIVGFVAAQRWHSRAIGHRDLSERLL